MLNDLRTAIIPPSGYFLKSITTRGYYFKNNIEKPKNVEIEIFNNKGFIEKKTTFSPHGQILTKDIYKYNSQNQLIKQFSNDGLMFPEYTIEYKYNLSGRKISSIDSIGQHYTWSYSENVIIENTDDDQVFTTYYIDSKERVIKSISTGLSRNFNAESYEFDEAGRISTIKLFNSYDNFVVASKDFLYDACGHEIYKSDKFFLNSDYNIFKIYKWEITKKNEKEIEIEGKFHIYKTSLDGTEIQDPANILEYGSIIEVYLQLV